MEVNEIIKPENLVYAKTPVLRDVEMHYCLVVAMVWFINWWPK
jgi:hypothetical protein